ncbi:MAG: hypothetical protein AB1400_04080 [Pseudomonadota bacterium]|jgi:hypothetical protein
MTDSHDLLKERELRFAPDLTGQIERAYALLKCLDNFEVEYGPEPDCLTIRYSLLHYSLRGLEEALQREGFIFSEAALDKLKKEAIYYSEDVQYHNLKTPELPARNLEHEAIASVYDTHPHGDSDDTPKELRHQK